MKRGHDLSGLMKFATSLAWAEHLQDALADHLGPAMEAHDFEFDELADIVGNHWAGVLWGCAFEDLATRTVEPGGLNLVDEYLRRRGWNETGPAKLYMRMLRSSVMSIYEVSAIEAGTGFLARDLIRGGEPVQVSERSASRTLTAWDRIGARIVAVGGKHVLTGGLLSFTTDAADAAIGVVRDMAATRGVPPDAAIGDELLRELAPLIPTTWLFDIVPRAMGIAPVPTLHNGDGEEVVFHRTRFPFARGTTQAIISACLDTVPALQRETTHFWNWLGEKPGSGAKGTGRMAWGVTMADGTPVLGNVELKGRALFLAVTSTERAARGTALIADTLGDLVGTPLSEIETIEQAMAARRDMPPEPTPTIAPEVATPLVHAMLDRQYRAVLDEPVPILGDITPRAATKSKAGRDRLAAWLKHLENSSGRQADLADPMATYDFHLDVARTRR